MGKEIEARDIALNEYNKFMEKYKANIEAGETKLMMHMMRLEANKITTQSVVDTIEKSEAGVDKTVYGNTKMKMQMSEDEYNIDQGIKKVDERVQERERAFIEMATRPISIGDPDKMDSYSMQPASMELADDTPKQADNIVAITDTQKNIMGQLGHVEPEKAPEPEPLITVDPKTGKKTYNGPKLRSRKIVDGKTWDSSHPNFHDENVGGM